MNGLVMVILLGMGATAGYMFAALATAGTREDHANELAWYRQRYPQKWN